MNDDHMRNGQLKPGYNVQFAVNSKFITGIGIYADRTDYDTLPPLDTLEEKHGMKYQRVVTDAGYESLKKLNMDRITMKCYMGDMGLLISHAFDENGIVSEEIYRKLLFDKLEVNTGMIMENLVAQMLAAAGHQLYFYANSDRVDSESRMEIDFLISKSKVSSRHNTSPIEVKSSKNYTLSSLRKFMKKYQERLHTLYVLHPADLKIEEGIVFLPLYMTPLL